MGRQITQLGISFDRGLNDKMCVLLIFAKRNFYFKRPEDTQSRMDALSQLIQFQFSNLIFQSDGWMNLSVVKIEFM